MKIVLETLLQRGPKAQTGLEHRNILPQIQDGILNFGSLTYFTHGPLKIVDLVLRRNCQEVVQIVQVCNVSISSVI